MLRIAFNHKQYPDFLTSWSVDNYLENFKSWNLPILRGYLEIVFYSQIVNE